MFRRQGKSKSRYGIHLEFPRSETGTKLESEAWLFTVHKLPSLYTTSKNITIMAGILPPFTAATAHTKVKVAQALWNTWYHTSVALSKSAMLISNI